MSVAEQAANQVYHGGLSDVERGNDDLAHKKPDAVATPE
jgi:hypothetical protein